MAKRQRRTYIGEFKSPMLLMNGWAGRRLILLNTKQNLQLLGGLLLTGNIFISARKSTSKDGRLLPAIQNHAASLMFYLVKFFYI